MEPIPKTLTAIQWSQSRLHEQLLWHSQQLSLLNDTDTAIYFCDEYKSFVQAITLPTDLSTTEQAVKLYLAIHQENILGNFGISIEDSKDWTIEFGTNNDKQILKATHCQGAERRENGSYTDIITNIEQRLPSLPV